MINIKNIIEDMNLIFLNEIIYFYEKYIIIYNKFKNLINLMI